VRSKLCAKMLSELCVLCERKNSTKCASSPIGVTSHTTPPPAQLDLGEATMSTFFTRHAPLFLRQGRTGREERRFYIQEQALLEARGA